MKTTLEIVIEALELQSRNPDTSPEVRNALRKVALTCRNLEQRELLLEEENCKQTLTLENADPLGQS